MDGVTHKLTEQENANILLSVSVPAKEIKNTYNKSVVDIAKKVQIKGFRKGKVPIEVLERKFGDALKAEAMEKVITEAMQSVMEKVEKKPLMYSRPVLQDEKKLDLDLEKDFTFSVTYDTEPKIEPADVSKLTLEVPKVEITEDDIQEEIKGIQERNAIMTEKKEPIADKDVVTITFVEQDNDGNDIENTKRENFTLTIGSGQTLYDIDPDLIGLSVNDTKIITKTFPKDYKYKELADQTKKLHVKVTAVKKKELPKIDDELAQDVNEKYKTLDDLSKDLKVQLKDRATHIVEDNNRKKIMEFLREKSDVEVPKSAVDYQLENLWHNFIQRNGQDENQILTSLQQMGQTKEGLLETWRENAKTQVVEQFVMAALIDKEKIEVSDDDVEKTLKEDCEKTGSNFEEIKEYYTKHNILPQIKHDMVQKKLFEILKSRTTIKEGKKINFSTLLKENEHNHEHQH